jgi:hypothetical protein
VGEAIAIFEPLLTERERILGPTHPGTLATRGNLALTYQDAGRVGRPARELFRFVSTVSVARWSCLLSMRQSGGVHSGSSA